MNEFNISEIFQFAIKIEENGEKFYKELSEKLEDKDTKELFAYLADEEIKHKRTFEVLLSKFQKYESPETYPSEYFTYLQAYANNIVFDVEKLENEISQINNAMDAISFAIKMEADSVLYYLQIKDLIPKDQHKLIDNIVEEERKHYVNLTEIKKWS